MIINSFLIPHICLVPVFNRKHWGMFWWLELWISIEQKVERHSQSNLNKHSFLFLFVILLWSVSQEQLSITSIFAIQIFLALKLKSRNICQTDILHFLFAEFLPFTELLCYLNHQIKETCIQLSAFVHLQRSRNDQSFKNSQIG